MTAPSTTENTVLVDVKELAAHWKVSVPTARNLTKSVDFPAVLELGPRTKRWPILEVDEWEQRKRREVVRRVVTGMRPQHLVGDRPLTWRTSRAGVQVAR